MTWPFLTMLLKSAPSHWMLPDTWLPTCTVVTACSVPGGADRVDDVAAGDRRGVTWISVLSAANTGAGAAADNEGRRITSAMIAFFMLGLLHGRVGVYGCHHVIVIPMR